MDAYPDTSFLCSLYRLQVFTPKAIAFMEARTGPLTVSSLLLLEFRQSVRFQANLHARDRTKGFSGHEAAQMLRDLESDLRDSVLETVPADWAAVHRIAEDLSSRHTERAGCRFADILHVATALQLGKRLFLTFDDKQAELAAAEGLELGVGPAAK
jgi:predicted nucleic acid-binding protein